MGYYVFIETCGIPLYSKVAILMANMMMMINYEIFGYPAFRQLPLFSKKSMVPKLLNYPLVKLAI